MKERMKDQEFREKMRKSLIGKKTSDETKNEGKISLIRG